MSSISMSRVWAMPSADTFDIQPIGDLVRRHLAESKVSVDPFARNRRWATYTNDLNPETKAEYHMEALEFLELLRGRGVRPDLAIFDPPYSLHQAKQVYDHVGKQFMVDDAQTVGRWTAHKHVMSQMMQPEATVLTFGWNSQGIGKKHGFGLVEVLLVCHGGAHNDTICTVERRIQPRLELA